MSKITNAPLTPVCHRKLHCCTHMATVGVEGLTNDWNKQLWQTLTKWHETDADQWPK